MADAKTRTILVKRPFTLRRDAKAVEGGADNATTFGVGVHEVTPADADHWFVKAHSEEVASGDLARIKGGVLAQLSFGDIKKRAAACGVEVTDEDNMETLAGKIETAEREAAEASGDAKPPERKSKTAKDKTAASGAADA